MMACRTALPCVLARRTNSSSGRLFGTRELTRELARVTREPAALTPAGPSNGVANAAVGGADGGGKVRWGLTRLAHELDLLVITYASTHAHMGTRARLARPRSPSQNQRACLPNPLAERWCSRQQR